VGGHDSRAFSPCQAIDSGELKKAKESKPPETNIDPDVLLTPLQSNERQLKQNNCQAFRLLRELSTVFLMQEQLKEPLPENRLSNRAYGSGTISTAPKF
jgi:hypothetical protein